MKRLFPLALPLFTCTFASAQLPSADRATPHEQSVVGVHPSTMVPLMADRQGAGVVAHASDRSVISNMTPKPGDLAVAKQLPSVACDSGIISSQSSDRVHRLVDAHGRREGMKDHVSGNRDRSILPANPDRSVAPNQ